MCVWLSEGAAPGPPRLLGQGQGLCIRTGPCGVTATTGQTSDCRTAAPGVRGGAMLVRVGPERRQQPDCMRSGFLRQGRCACTPVAGERRARFPSLTPRRGAHRPCPEEPKSAQTSGFHAETTRCGLLASDPGLPFCKAALVTYANQHFPSPPGRMPPTPAKSVRPCRRGGHTRARAHTQSHTPHLCASTRSTRPLASHLHVHTLHTHSRAHLAKKRSPPPPETALQSPCTPVCSHLCFGSTHD